MNGRLPHLQRSDARDNRQRLVEAARAVFAVEGLDAPLRRVARKAEVGPATLYRHFPTKEALAVEAFREEMRACHTIVAEGLADPDPWRGFCHVVETTCELHAVNRGFTAAFVSTFPDAVDFTASRRQTLDGIAELARRAQAAGTLRPDFALDDLVLMLMAQRGIRAGSPAARLAAARRFAALAIQGFRASPDAAPLPPVPRLAPAA